MSNKRKGHSPYKRKRLLAQHLLKNSVIAYTTGEPNCILLNRKTLKREVVHSINYSLITTLPYKWSVYLAALGKKDGENFVMGDIVISPDYYYQTDLIPFLEDQHQQVIKRMNSKWYIGAAWVASPFGYDFSEEEAYRIFDSIGAFDRYKDPETGAVYRGERAT
jgi:hypothetical protein